MAAIGATPKLKFKRDRDRYIVFLGDDRIGFVRRWATDSRWNAVDTFMEKDATYDTRNHAAEWLKREFQRAVREGKV